MNHIHDYNSEYPHRIQLFHRIPHGLLVLSCYIMLYYVISCYIMLYHVISCYIMLYHVISCYIMLYHVISCYIMLYHVISCYIMLYHVISCYIMLYHVILCYIMLYYVISCYIMLDLPSWLYLPSMKSQNIFSSPWISWLPAASFRLGEWLRFNDLSCYKRSKIIYIWYDD